MGLPGIYGKPGMTGPSGPRGVKGDRGEPGIQGTVGIPGGRGIPGAMGGRGPRGEKGEKGDSGVMGMPGPPGNPGLSISAPQAILLPVANLIDEGENVTFNCTSGGNPAPIVVWKFESKRLWAGLKYVIEEGILIINSLNFSDTGLYSCVATSALGSAEAFANLTVRGKRLPKKRLYNFILFCLSLGYWRATPNLWLVSVPQRIYLK